MITVHLPFQKTFFSCPHHRLCFIVILVPVNAKANFKVTSEVGDMGMSRRSVRLD